MAWISVKQRLPEPFVKVWVMTDIGKRVTGYVKSNGDWYLLCRKVAAEKPEVIRWEDGNVLNSTLELHQCCDHLPARL
ncbi:hypothetical protein CPL38_13370 [Salmonella enterica]|nr:hypothetical protein [Salmonella enterica]